MDSKFFTLTRIEGEYAYLRDNETSEELFIALALLPCGADEGSLLKYENLEFSIYENS